MNDALSPEKQRWLAAIQNALRHPIRNRIIATLRDGPPRSQHELGQELSLSNAAVHYHVKLLTQLGLLKLDSTRPGPNCIIEKLYAVDMDAWQSVSALTGINPELQLYVEHVASWMQERHREGLALLASDPAKAPFLAGSYEVRASLTEVAAFKQRIHELFTAFFAEHENHAAREDLPAFAVTLSLFPARGKNVADSRYVIEYCPEIPIVKSPEPQATARKRRKRK